MGVVCPTRVERSAYDIRILAYCKGLSAIARLDCQGGWRFERALGRSIIALSGPRIQGTNRLWGRRRREFARLADHARRTCAVLRQSGGPHGRDADQWNSRFA